MKMKKMRTKKKKFKYSTFVVNIHHATRVFPPLMRTHYGQAGIGDSVLDLFNVLNLLVPSILQADQRLWYCRTNVPNFRNLGPWDRCIPPFDVLPPQSAR